MYAFMVDQKMKRKKNLEEPIGRANQEKKYIY